MALLWTEAVAPTRYVTHHELGQMYSGDHDVKMHKALSEMRREWRTDQEAGLTQVSEGLHPGHVEHGGPDGYIKHIQDDIAQNGMREPLSVRGGNVVIDGHHRGLAAMNLKMDKIPVRDFR